MTRRSLSVTRRSLSVLAGLLLTGSIPAAAPAIGSAVAALQDAPPGPVEVWAKRLPDLADSARYVLGWSAPDSVTVDLYQATYQVRPLRAGTTPIIQHQGPAAVDTLTLPLPPPGAADTIYPAVRLVTTGGEVSAWVQPSAILLSGPGVVGTPTDPADTADVPQIDTPDRRASYVQGAINGTLTYLNRALAEISAGDTTQAAADVRQARGRVRATLTHVLVLRQLLAADSDSGGPAPVRRMLAAHLALTVAAGDTAQLCGWTLYSDSSVVLDADVADVPACQQAAATARSGD